MLQSVSRLSGDLNQKESQSWIDQARECLAEYHQHKDIITLGAYKSGSNQQIDRAIAIRPALNKFLKQSKEQAWKEKYGNPSTDPADRIINALLNKRKIPWLHEKIYI